MKKIISLLFTFLLTLSFAFADEVPAKFYTSKTLVKTGDTVEFELRVVPANGKNVFTFIPSLNFEKDKLKFIGSEVSEGVVSAAANDVTDLNSGNIKRTLGVPGGVVSEKSLIKYKFLAVAPGQTTVKILGGDVLDDKNQVNTLQAKELSVSLSGEKIQLPDVQKISLSYSGPESLGDDQDLDFTANMELAQKADTSGSVFVNIFDQEGKLVVLDEKLFKISDSTKMPIKVSKDLLIPGNYSLVLLAKYGDNQEERVVNSLVVKASGNLVPEMSSIWYLVGGLFVLLALFLVYVFTGGQGRKVSTKRKK
jgi:hypothetical protein